MDNRRLILLMIFGLSPVMLWEAWQKHNLPKAPAQNAAQTSAATPQPTANLQAGTATPAPMVTPAPTVPGAVPVASAATGQTITIKTDLFTADIATVGGDLTHLELSRYTATEDKGKIFSLFEPKHHYAAQTGLIGEGLPNHRTVFAAVNSPREMAKDGGKDVISFGPPSLLPGVLGEGNIPDTGFGL